MGVAGWKLIVIAGVAAVLGMFSRRASHTRLDVKTNPSLLVWDGTTEECVDVAVRNRSQHAVNVTAVGFILEDGTARHVPYRILDATIPGEVSARNEGVAHMLLDSLRDVADVELRAYVRDGEGKTHFARETFKPESLALLR